MCRNGPLLWDFPERRRLHDVLVCCRTLIEVSRDKGQDRTEALTWILTILTVGSRQQERRLRAAAAPVHLLWSYYCNTSSWDTNTSGVFTEWGLINQISSNLWNSEVRKSDSREETQNLPEPNIQLFKVSKLLLTSDDLKEQFTQESKLGHNLLKMKLNEKKNINYVTWTDLKWTRADTMILSGYLK